MAKLTVQNVTPAGLALSASLAAAAALGDSVDSSSGLVLVVENADAGSHTVTLTAPVATAQAGNYGQQTVADIAVAVAAGTTQLITIPAGFAELGVFSWTYDSETGVSVGVLSLTPDA